ncbi:MAG TPA: hypothetical protein VGE52_08550, partial [Pirellulales bacterium]
NSMSMKRRSRHSLEQSVRKLRDTNAMLNAEKASAAALQALEVSESTLAWWWGALRGATSKEAVRFKEFKDENRRLCETLS